MNNIRVLGGICCMCLLAGGSFAQNTQFVPLDVPTVIERGMHHRLWQTVSSSTDENGNMNYQTNSFTELRSGICYEEDGKWYDSVEEIELHPDGAFAQRAPHKVFFSPNLNEEGAVELISPEGMRLKGGPLGLAYYDKEKHQSVWIARIQDCKGELYSSNQVVYRDAMDGILCSVRYTYKLGSFEQDVILHEAPPAPEEYGFSSETTFLEVISDFQEIPEDFTIRQYVSEAKTEAGKVVGKDWEDNQLEFGSMRMAAGKAFSLSEEESPRQLTDREIPVSKSFQITDGKNILIEGVEYHSIHPYLEVLPLKVWDEEALVQKPTSGRTFFLLPKKHETQNPMMFASSGQALPQGVVIDYLAVTSSSNMTFKSDTTYYVSGPVTLSGTTTLEGGSVIKYDNVNDPGITVTGPIVTRTGPGRSVILTAKDDNSVGEILPNSTGTPSGYYGLYPFVVDYLYYPVETLMSYMRFSHLNNALLYIDQSQHVLKHVQFAHCSIAVTLSSSIVSIQNGLFYDCNAMFNSSQHGGSYGNGTMNGVNLTLDDALSLNPGVVSVYLKNTIISAMPNSGWDTSSSSQVFYRSTSDGVYSSVGEGSHYLAESSLMNAGYTDIDSTLLSELRGKTTKPPRVLTGVIAEDVILGPVAYRDVDGLDVGYHYDPLDYIACNTVVSNATLTLTNGVSFGVYGNTGIRLHGNSKLLSEGRPERLNRIVRSQAIQEQANVNWTSGTNLSLLSEDASSGTLSTIQLRFTDLSQLSGGRVILSGGNKLSSFSLVDCQLYNGLLSLNETVSSGCSSCFTNNLFDHVKLTLGNSANAFSAWLYNNTFYASTNAFLPASGNTWMIYDNYFHSVFNTQNTNLNGRHNYNGYYSPGTTRLTPNATNDIVVTSAAPFVSGDLGSFYHISSSPLVNAGSRSSANAGLYHYTTQTSNAKEGNTQVDIGFHYVGVNTSGLPWDEDGDGYPDYQEDRNGNGTFANDSGETDWGSSNTRLNTSSFLFVYTPLK